MKIAYIAHPIGGNVSNNIDKVLNIVRTINLLEDNTVPFAPYVSDVLALNDNLAHERKRGMKNNFHLINFATELRLYGNRITSGMWDEISVARDCNIPIIAMTLETRIELDSKS